MVSLQIHVHSEPQNVTLFGNRAFADGIETKQNPIVPPPLHVFCQPLSVENVSQRISLFKEMRNAETKENKEDQIIIM